MYKSHRLQELLNYFDEHDVRVREQAYTLDAQLLNGPATQLDDLTLRWVREIDARLLGTTPVLLDNRGVYHAVRLANSVALTADQTALPLVQGRNTGDLDWTTLTPFDDRLPVPAAYERDPARESVVLENPILCDLTGDGDPETQTWLVQTAGPATLPVPNRLTFFVEDVGTWPLALTILVEGETYPVPVWAQRRQPTRETLTRWTAGAFETTKTWATVSRITVRGLPLGVRLRVWTLPVSLPAVPDTLRPVTMAAHRGLTFDRYWQLVPADQQVKETYLLDNAGGLEVLTPYAAPADLTALAVEPRTWGLLAGGGQRLYYVDRREPLPTHLDVTALTREPAYGLDCQYNFTRPGAVRYLYIRPVPYGRATKVTKWRYLVETPAGLLRVVLPAGSLAPYGGGVGWQRGTPTAFNLPLAEIGTYVITLECLDDQDTVSIDSAPYPNLALTGTEFDLTGVVPEIRGLAYDSRETLWVWTGDLAVPIRPRYHSYVLDAASRMLYLTAPFDEVSYE